MRIFMYYPGYITAHILFVLASKAGKTRVSTCMFSPASVAVEGVRSLVPMRARLYGYKSRNDQDKNKNKNKK